MNDKPDPEESLADEFLTLGRNLAQALKTAWDNPERKRVQDQVITSFNDVGGTLKREAENFAASPASQQIKAEVEKIGERLRGSEAQEKIRVELLAALKTANAELQKVVDNWSPTQPGDSSQAGDAPAEPAPQEPEQHS